MSVEAFYDGLAADHHLVYADCWDEAVAGQGEALARPIGRQTIGLALRGFAVTGTDLSAASVERARREAQRLGATLRLGVAEFRDLSGVDGTARSTACASSCSPRVRTAGACASTRAATGR